MRRSFAIRLTAAFAGVGIAAAAVTAILVNLAFGSRFTSYLEAQQQARQQQLIAGLAASYEKSGGWSPTDLRSLESLALMDGGTLRLVDTSGHAVWDPSAGAGGQLAEMHRQMMGSGPLGPEQRLPIRVDGTVVGTAIVRVPAAGLLPQDVSFRSSVNHMLLVGGILAGLVALTIGLILARRATAPARELTRAARAFADGDRAERVTFEAADELGEMARAFNSMADTIEEEDRLRQVFAAEVAHELRTPLMILRTQIEGIQDGVVSASAPSLASLHEETLRLTRLVADLETLASADAAGFSLVRESVDLRALLAEALAEFSDRFAEEDVRLASELEDVVLDGDPIRLRQIVANLLSNALKYTPAGGSVELRCEREGEVAAIRVRDSGPGIPPDELPHVFDRFFRGRRARVAGSGIGLTVARELVLAHGGSIEVESAEGQGATFTVRLALPSPGERGSFTAGSHRPDTLVSKGGSIR